MLQPVGKENQIGFMNMDFSKLSQEVEQINEAKNNKAEKPMRVSKQTSGSLYRQQTYNKMAFVDEQPQSVPNQEPESVPVKRNPRLSGDFEQNLHLTSKSIMSAKAAGISNNGGPSAQMNSVSSNSIWDTGKIERGAKQAAADKQKAQDKAELEANIHEAMQNERMDQLTDSLKDTDQRKSSCISAMPEQQGSSYHASSNNLSIFDFMDTGASKDFERLADSTGGEQVSQKKSAQKQESKKQSQKQFTNQDVLNRLFDNLSG